MANVSILYYLKTPKKQRFSAVLGDIKWEHWLEIGYGTGEGQGSHQRSRIFTSIQLLTKTKTFSAGIYLFKVNNDNKRTM